MALGWPVPKPSRRVTKTELEFKQEREAMASRLVGQCFIRSPEIAEAMRRVPRERFVPLEYRDYTYCEIPLPLLGNGKNQTISCPHSYPLFYEALKLGKGDRFLEIGTGSGYGAALAREIVGEQGKVVSIEINEKTHDFARRNLRELGYNDIVVVLGDGSEGYAHEAPYDKISVTASCPRIPRPLVEQLRLRGRLIAPVGSPKEPQNLTLLEKGEGQEPKLRVVEHVLYVPLIGKHGWRISSLGHRH